MHGDLTLGRAIRAVRLAGGFKQRELAEVLDVTHTYISHLEADRREPSVRLLRTISAALNAPPGLFLSLALWADMPEKDRGPYRQIFESLVELASLSARPAPDGGTTPRLEGSWQGFAD